MSSVHDVPTSPPAHYSVDDLAPEDHAPDVPALLSAADDDTTPAATDVTASLSAAEGDMPVAVDVLSPNVPASPGPLDVGPTTASAASSPSSACATQAIQGLLIVIFTVMPFNDTREGLMWFGIRVGLVAIVMAVFPARIVYSPGVTHAGLLLAFGVASIGAWESGFGLVTGVVSYYMCCAVRRVNPAHMGLVGRPMLYLVGYTFSKGYTSVNTACRNPPHHPSSSKSKLPV
ncbi:hypothetical protein B0H12DRAFT_1231142 [Mycena haematopus]|nr:hypothetical protein B0H12DRAFT_1231142 [Mycena haematopus]